MYYSSMLRHFLFHFFLAIHFHRTWPLRDGSLKYFCSMWSLVCIAIDRYPMIYFRGIANGIYFVTFDL